MRDDREMTSFRQHPIRTLSGTEKTSPDLQYRQMRDIFCQKTDAKEINSKPCDTGIRRFCYEETSREENVQHLDDSDGVETYN